METLNLSNLRPDIFIIHAGTNNINAKMSDTSCLREMEELCDLVLGNCSNTRIFISGVICRKVGMWESSQTEVDYLNSRIRNLNKSLQIFCAGHRYQIIDNSSITATYLHRDGLHLNDDGDNRLSTALYNCFHEPGPETCQENMFSLTKDFPPLPQKSDFSFSQTACSAAIERNSNVFLSHQSVGESNKKAGMLKNLSQKYKKKMQKLSLYRKPLIKNFNINHQQDSYSGQKQCTASSNPIHIGGSAVAQW